MAGFDSLLREWVLVDRLVGAEIVAFARTVVASEKVVGMPVRQPIPPQSQLLKSASWKGLRAVRWAIGKLVLTAVVAAILSDGDSLIFWLLFSVTTAVRYLRPRQPAPDANAVQLLSDMASAYRRLREVEFNAGLVRHLLHEVESRGAIFNVWVYNILDRRNRRLQGTS